MLECIKDIIKKDIYEEILHLNKVAHEIKEVLCANEVHLDIDKTGIPYIDVYYYTLFRENIQHIIEDIKIELNKIMNNIIEEMHLSEIKAFASEKRCIEYINKNYIKGKRKCKSKIILRIKELLENKLNTKIKIYSVYTHSTGNLLDVFVILKFDDCSVLITFLL